MQNACTEFLRHQQNIDKSHNGSGTFFVASAFRRVWPGRCIVLSLSLYRLTTCALDEGGSRTAASCQRQARRPSAIPLHHSASYGSGTTWVAIAVNVAIDPHPLTRSGWWCLLSHPRPSAFFCASAIWGMSPGRCIVLSLSLCTTSRLAPWTSGESNRG